MIFAWGILLLGILNLIGNIKMVIDNDDANAIVVSFLASYLLILGSVQYIWG